MKTEFEVKDQKLTIKRYPIVQNETLQAWNAADELLIDYIQSQNIQNASRVLIINDQFGFLTALCQSFQTTTLVDSKSAMDSIIANCAANDLGKPTIQPITDQLQGKFNFVLIHMPKSIDLLNHYLQLLDGHVLQTSVIVSGFMTRHFTAAYLNSFQTVYEKVEQSKAQKKARLIIAKQYKKVENKSKPFEYIIEIDQTALKIQSHAGVFSARKADKGSLFLLDNLPKIAEDSNILDLGSGSGLIALAVWATENSSHIIAVDDSYLAIEASKETLKPVLEKSIFCNYNLSDLDDDSVDLILSNLPFHTEHSNNQELALRLITETVRVLKSGHEFRFVANRHLGLRNFLLSQFKSVSVIAENKSYIIWSCFK